MKMVLMIGMIGLGMFSVRAQTERNVDLIFVGDSITAAKTPAEASVAALREVTGIGDVRAVNTAVSGFTTLNYLPVEGKKEQEIVAAMKQFSDQTNTVVISVMLGTNDSAFHGSLGSPVSPADYAKNLSTLIDRWLVLNPRTIVVLNMPIWYSPNTHNRSCYLLDGYERLQSYFPQIKAVVAAYAKTHPRRVFEGSEKGWSYFEKTHLETMNHEKGPAGIFFLHPNKKGGEMLGQFWAERMAQILLHEGGLKY